MVHGDQQNMFVFGLMDKPAADQRPAGQIESGVGFNFEQPVILFFRILLLTQVVFLQKKGMVLHRADALHRLSIDQHKGSAQNLMSGHDPIQRSAKCSSVEAA